MSIELQTCAALYRVESGGDRCVYRFGAGCGGRSQSADYWIRFGLSLVVDSRAGGE